MFSKNSRAAMLTIAAAILGGFLTFVFDVGSKIYDEIILVNDREVTNSALWYEVRSNLQRYRAVMVGGSWARQIEEARQNLVDTINMDHLVATMDGARNQIISNMNNSKIFLSDVSDYLRRIELKDYGEKSTISDIKTLVFLIYEEPIYVMNQNILRLKQGKELVFISYDYHGFDDTKGEVLREFDDRAKHIEEKLIPNLNILIECTIDSINKISKNESVPAPVCINERMRIKAIKKMGDML